MSYLNKYLKYKKKYIQLKKMNGGFGFYSNFIHARENLQNTQSHQKGGLSGKPIELKSSELIRKFYKVLKGRIKIIGVGGVDSGRSAYQKFLAGADYLQLYTGMVFRGPNIVGLIKKELKEILLKDGVKNFNEIVGKKD